MTKSVLAINNLTKRYSPWLKRESVLAVNNISLELFEGETFGLLGPNGAGKTTTLSMLLGLLRPTQGNISILGQDIFSLDIRRQIGYLPETPRLYDFLSGEEMIYLAIDLFHIPASERKQIAEQTLSLVGMKDFCRRRLATYSKGMLQRIGLGQALVNKPKILFLDEPVSGLDPQGIIDVRNIILQLKKEGTTILLNSHQLSEVERVCDRVAFIKNGQLLEVYSLKENGTGKQSVRIKLLETNDLTRQKLRQRFSGLEHNEIVITAEKQEDISEALEAIQGAGAKVLSVIPQKENLEDKFLRVCGGAAK